MSAIKIPTVPELRNDLDVKNKIQTKILTGNVSNPGVIPELTFNNLVVGKWYEVRGQIVSAVNFAGGVDNDVRVFFVNNSSTVHVAFLRDVDDVFTQVNQAVSFVFKAEGTTLTLDADRVSASAVVRGSGNKFDTYIQLEERNDLEETTDFT